MHGAEQPKLTENPYRAVLVAARAEVLCGLAAVRGILAAPRRTLAMSWRCPAADVFAAGLASVERRALRALEESLAELDAKIRAQPELVPLDAWQVGWRSALDSSENPMRTWVR